jgi:hypothetical protein
VSKNEELKAFLTKIAADSTTAPGILFSARFGGESLSDGELEGIAGGRKNSATTLCRGMANCPVTDYGLNCMK